MKYVYGKKIRTLRDRLTTGVAALALLANSAGVALPVLLTQKVAAAPATTVTSTSPSGWAETNVRGDGVSNITSDRPDAHGGNGSLKQSFSNGAGKTDYRKLSSYGPVNTLTTLSFEWYRDSSSTAPAHFTPAVGLYVDDGAGNSWLLKWEGVYNGYPTNGPAAPTDTWVQENLIDSNFWRIPQYVNGSWVGFDGCNQSGDPYQCYVFNRKLSDTWLNGFNVAGLETGIGSGWNGSFTSYVDYITINDSVYDFEVVPSAPALSNLAFVSKNDSEYSGVFMEFGISNFSDATDVYVTIERENGGDVVKRMNPAKHASYINDGGARTLTVPFPIIEGTYTEAGSSSWIPMTNNNWNSATVPTFAYATVVTPSGNITGAKIPFNGTYNKNLLSTPSTNEINKSKTPTKWAHVNEQSKNVGSVELEFVSERGFWSCFEYRTDGDISQVVSPTNPNTQITDGQYPDICLNNDTEVRTISANEYVEVRMVYGAEKDERFNWTRFDVLEDTTPPAIPTNLSWTPDSGTPLANGSYTNIQKGTLAWQNTDPDVDHYTYHFWTDIPGYYEGQSNAWSTPDGSSYITQSPTGGSIWTDFYDKEGTYYFCVEAVDTAGNRSNCSEVFSLTFDQTAPAKPVVLGIYKGHNNNPDNLLSCGGITNSTQIRIDWDDVDGAEYYWFGNKFNQKHKKVTVSHYNGNMTPGNNPYYYTVIAVDAAGNESPVSAQCSITLDQDAPDAFNVSPADDSVVNGASVTQEWGSSAPDVAYYIYESYRDAGANNLRWHEKINGTSKTATNVADATYWWRVKAVDHAGNESAWSELWKLTVNNTVSPVLTADYFTVHDDHLGVGFTIADFVDATLVEVAIYDAADNLLTQNTGDSATMLALLNSHTGQISSPFYIPFGDLTDGYWNFGNADWPNVLPAYAVVTIHYGDGDIAKDRVDLVSPNPDTNIRYQDLIAGMTQGACTGEDVNCDDSNSDGSDDSDEIEEETKEPTEEPGVVAGLITNTPSGGSVLGDNTGLTNTGTQNGGLLVLLAAGLMTVALATLRRKQEN